MTHESSTQVSARPPQGAESALLAFFFNCTEDWHRPVSPRSQGALACTSRAFGFHDCRRSHLLGMYKTAAMEQLATGVEPAVVAAAAAHPSCQSLSAEVVQWRQDAAAAAGAEKSHLTEAWRNQLFTLRFKRIIEAGLGTLRAVLDAGMDINSVDMGHGTLLMYASEAGKDSLVQLLLERRAHVLASTQSQKTALTCAVESGHVSSVRLLVDALIQQKPAVMPMAEGHQNGSQETGESEHMDAALLRACSLGKYEVAQFLIDSGASVWGTGTSGLYRNPLFEAAKECHIKVVQLLLERKADPENKIAGFTELHRASTNASTHAVALARVLIEGGADLEAKTSSSGFTPLVCAVIDGNVDMVQFLIAQGASVNVRLQDGRSPVELAALMRKDAALKILQNATQDRQEHPAVAAPPKEVTSPPSYREPQDRAWVGQIERRSPHRSFLHCDPMPIGSIDHMYLACM
eukprot:gnl/MRDRNA2_/MRDRNA2_214653_c0_seq1.p1 gnl/MRDRNA2_/MRDRNA2_214653_c0~~gnl/MRDRNA2_/MRDRNA2_214653_c0_seq1.p1  ORF type:complete len:487 (+),score=95.00 gnl/MRDRNA2_/MRDRNA2_214653_c0_seq1:73-1461(+)